MFTPNISILNPDEPYSPCECASTEARGAGIGTLNLQSLIHCLPTFPATLSTPQSAAIAVRAIALLPDDLNQNMDRL
jgi:hypothetical protein